MLRHRLWIAVSLLGCLGLAAGPVQALDEIWDLEAIDASGVGTHPSLSLPPKNPAAWVTFQGVVLNRPQDMLDTATQWQMYVQALPTNPAPYNQGGIALYANTFYDPTGWPRYSNDWLPGDVVEVHGLLLYYNGKTNLNERHDGDNIFAVTLIEHGTLPAPQRLSSIAEAITFDPTRATGGERYQAQWCRLDGARVTTGTWAANQTVTITDDSGATMAMLLGALGDFTQGAPPPGRFTVTALLDQEDTTAPYQDSYRLWPLAYSQIAVWGDTNGDGVVDFSDYQTLAVNYGNTAGATWFMGDYNRDGAVDFADYQNLAVNYGYGTLVAQPPIFVPAPEPATLGLLCLGGLGLAAARRRRACHILAGALALLTPAAVAQASMVTLDLTADSGQWQVWAAVSGNCRGLDSFSLDVTATGGLAVTSSLNRAPQSDNGIADLFGFHKFRSNGSAGADIQAAQDSIYGSSNDPAKDARLLLDVGIAAGSRPDVLSGHTIAWDAPVLLASGTYAGASGWLQADGSFTVLKTLSGGGWTGPGNVEFATVVGDTVQVPEPATLGLAAAGLGLLAARRRLKRASAGASGA